MIENLKDLEKLIKLCRKNGVYDIDLMGVKLKLGDLPQEVGITQSGQMGETHDQYKGFPSGNLTPEQLMFYSAGGTPEDDPVLKAKEAS